jgi:UTP-glucose-1-phosphate uridylyltransferase
MNKTQMNEHNGPALAILAAGLGRRYGGYKQLDTFGPDDESIMDLSIIDGIRAGFKKIILIINRDIENQIRKTVVSKYQNQVKMDCVFQELNALPAGFKVPEIRKKPWGTGHAVLSVREAVETPFAVINADDFYGGSAFTQIKKELDRMAQNSHEFCMLGYRLKNTLSSHGGVSRGICRAEDDYLESISETRNIRKTGTIIRGEADEQKIDLSPDAIVSMNFWGFSPAVFPILNERFSTFLENKGKEENSEFFITDALDRPVSDGNIKIRVLDTQEKWFGVTYAQDREEVRNGIQRYFKESERKIDLD